MSSPIVVNPKEVCTTNRCVNRNGLIRRRHGSSTAAGTEDKTKRVVAYASTGLKEHEKNYPAFLFEKAAACWGIDYFDMYLTPPRQFTLCTENRPLKTMSTIHKKTLNNLQLLMLKFNFVIEYKEGWRNTIADALSRTHAGVPICVVTRSSRRTAEDNRVQHTGRSKKKKRETLATRTMAKFQVRRL
jgi:hypothetical protein